VEGSIAVVGNACHNNVIGDQPDFGYPA